MGVGALGNRRPKGAGQRTRNVKEDWCAWIPNEMDELFDLTRQELESSNFILSITINEALQLCKGGRLETANERLEIFAGLFNRLAIRVSHVTRVIREHGIHFGTLPNVKPLSPANFRGATAQRLSLTNNLLAKVVFRQRTRFFHKLYALGEIVEELQKQMAEVVANFSQHTSRTTDQAWQMLEVLAYDLTTCMGETTIVLKSFFCALPPEELGTFREKLVNDTPNLFTIRTGTNRIP